MKLIDTLREKQTIKDMIVFAVWGMLASICGLYYYNWQFWVLYGYFLFVYACVKPVPYAYPPKDKK